MELSLQLTHELTRFGNQFKQGHSKDKCFKELLLTKDNCIIVEDLFHIYRSNLQYQCFVPEVNLFFRFSATQDFQFLGMLKII